MADTNPVDARYCYVPDLQGKGARVALLVGPGWSSFLLRKTGIDQPPFDVRARRADEPARHANGQPFGWMWTVADCLLNEKRYRTAEQMSTFEAALQGAIASARAAASLREAERTAQADAERGQAGDDGQAARIAETADA